MVPARNLGLPVRDWATPGRAHRSRPDQAVIGDASGADHPVVLDSSVIKSVRQEASDALDLLGAASQGGRLEARPTPGACATCPFRLLCEDFLNAYSPDWPCGQIRIVRLPSQPSATAGPIDADVLQPHWAAHDLQLVGFHLGAAAAGQVWGISDYEGPDTTALAR